jgi:hypothetical protein
VQLISGCYTATVQTITGLAIMKVPNTPAQITPAFLTAILRSAGVLRQGTVTAIQVEPLGARTSYNAQMARAEDISAESALLSPSAVQNPTQISHW